ncbi:hypothetical protein MJO28_015363 [Puccinia striiformis f. sp. tritici]|uniref:Uncharacterized protein n=1 Tax=Puccinia striiformis f. sp. tritici TaxID=168172 RepID=A0ACC0DVA2_9BASI|nr:hypothetical protein MJO28_015363 [Puccinia striiformis f. sp. tritici]
MGKNSKRHQREELELELLLTRIESEGEEEEEEITQPTKTLFNSFSNDLEEEEEEEEEEEDEELQATKKKKQNKKKKKKKNNTLTSTPTLDSQSVLKTAKRLTNGKQKAADDVDEIDQALQELKIEPQPQKSDIRDHHTEPIINNLLKVDPKMLDPDIELRRMFGAKVVSSSGSIMRALPATIYGARISNDPHHQMNSKLKMIKSSLLSKPEPTWPPYNRNSSGLSVRKMSEEEVLQTKLAGEDQWFCFRHSLSFKHTQSRFLQAILSADPNQLVTILQRSPYHPDTLLQLSEVSAHNDDQGQATTFLNQALYVNEKTISSFSSTFFSSGTARLDFKAVENRGFFKALDRKVLVLLKQGCYRSSFQTSKFLFSLNPYQDPFGSLLWLDFLAPKANQDQFFIDFLDNLAGLQDRDPNGGIYVEAYPGLYYARALCMRAIEEKDRCSNHDQSDFALESAILRFPQVLKPLSRAIGISLPSQYERIERAEVEEGYVEDFARNMLHLKARIYATRSSSLWKVDEISSWLRQILNRVVDKFAQSDDPDVQLGTQFETDPQLHSVAAEGIYRAVLVSDVQAFKNFLPPSVYSRSTTAFSFDPLPPVGGTTYDGEYFKITTEEEEQEQDSFREAERRGRRPQEEDDEDTHEGLDALFDVDHDDALLQPDQVDHLVAQIQFLLQLDNDQLSPDQRLSLLARLDRLLLLRPVFPDPNLLHDHQVEASADEGVPRMPGAF